MLAGRIPCCLSSSQWLLYVSASCFLQIGGPIHTDWGWLPKYRSELFLFVLDKGSIQQNTALVEQALQTFFGVHQGVVVRIHFLKIGFFVVMYVNERNDWHYHRIARVRHIRSDVFWSDFCANRRQFLATQTPADEVCRFPWQHFIPLR